MRKHGILDERRQTRPQGRIESIDPNRGIFRGWIETRDGTVPHLQIREGQVLRGSGVTVGSARNDVARAKGIKAVGFSISAGQSVSALDVKNGTTALYALWQHDDYQLPIIESCTKAIHSLVEQMPMDLKMVKGNFAHVAAPVGTRITGRDNEMSFFEVPVGATSGDGVSMMGKSGHLFLRGGGNSLESQYAWGTPSGPTDGAQRIEELATGWMRVIQQRSAAMSALGIPFRQIILPDKNSVLPGLMPISVQTPTPVCRELLERMPDSLPFLDAFAHFSAWDESVSPSWMKVDSHFSPHAALAVTEMIVTDLGLASSDLFAHIRIGPDFEYLRGDLGWRIAGFDIYDRLELPDESTMSLFGPSIEPSYSAIPLDGGHIGTTIEWINPLGPIDAHVLAFGNSFFGKGHKPNQMSWWFSRIFKKFTMVWSPDMNINIVKDSRPDAVVCQTVERFLTRLPEA